MGFVRVILRDLEPITGGIDGVDLTLEHFVYRLGMFLVTKTLVFHESSSVNQYSQIKNM